MNKDKDKEPQYLLQDPLREITRKERRNLLAVACIGIIIVWTKIDLSTLSILGCKLDLQTIPNEKLLQYLGAIVAYFWFAFFIYATSDLLARDFGKANTQVKQEEEKYQSESEQQKNGRMRKRPTSGRGRVPEPYLSVDIAGHERDLERRKIVQDAKDKRQSYYLPSKVTSYFRAAFDFGLPLVVGGYAFVLLMVR
jgi:hypothetical protein